VLYAVFSLCLVATGECRNVELPLPDRNVTPYACARQVQASIATYLATLPHSRGYRIERFGCVRGMGA
jgi:hypothetical protein